jgi:UDP-N-acetylmuramate dehydrogenase
MPSKLVQNKVDLKPYNTFGISVLAESFACFNSSDKLHEIITQTSCKNPFVLGGGSNILLTKDIDQLVLKNEITGIEVVEKDEKRVLVKVGAGENWHAFVCSAIANNWGGIENLSLIPGNVGASPMQNIGAYGVEIKDVFHSLNAYELSTGKIKTFFHSDCKFGYRESVFKRDLKNQYIIIDVTFRLTKVHQLNTSYGAIEEELEKNSITRPTLKDVSNAVIAIRQSKLPDPKKIGNAGSFFKNPVVKKEIVTEILKKHPNAPSYPVDDNYLKVPAGWLIEQAGWKGKDLGGYGVHTKQALVLVNYGETPGHKLLALSDAIIQDIQDKFGITLEREVNIY